MLKYEYISLTDIAKYRNDDEPRFVIQNWMRNRNTIEFLGVWEHYKKALVDGTHFAILVMDDGKFIGAGGVCFYNVMPTYHNSSGKKAYIMNMYTDPSYRRQGIAYKTLDMLVNVSKERGVKQISLEATDMGRPLYEKYGFVKMESEMELI